MPSIQFVLADGDTVSTSDLVRQSFYPSDVGLNKAAVLINRINTSCGLTWEAAARHLTAHDLTGARIDLLISCVDSHAARREVANGLEASPRVIYHLDLGNLRDCGQMVLGGP